MEIEEAQRRNELEMKRLELEQTHEWPGAQAPYIEDRAKAPKSFSFVDGKDDLDAYLQRFEKWDNGGGATKLSALLSGRPLDVYCRLSEEATSDDGKTRITLVKRYGLTGGGYERKFYLNTRD